MAVSFLDRFYEDVDLNLGDPSISKRLTRAQKLRLLYVVQKITWERLLRISGQESLLGRTESTITLKNGVEYYALPGNFRQFIRMELRKDGDPATILGTLGSVPFWEMETGVFIMSEQRGMMVRPVPNISGDEDWTLIYEKGEVKLHHATAEAVTSFSLKMGFPGPDAGEVVLTDDYYTGSLVGIYDATLGTQQVREIIGFQVAERTFQLRHPFSPIPTGTVKYEIRPLLPEAYDDLYAIDVAIRVLGRRKGARGRTGLKEDRRDIWDACQSYFASNVADRPPQRISPYRPSEPDPYEDM